MTDSVVPTVNFVPDLTQEGVTVVPGQALGSMLQQLEAGAGGDVPPAAVYQEVDSAILASPNLIAELNTASLDGEGFLRSIQYSATGTGMYYNSGTHTIVITQEYLNSLSNSPSVQNTLIEALGHEAYHAMDAMVMQPLYTQTYQAVKSTITAGGDATALLVNYANQRLADEANANLAGWNALVSTLDIATPSQQQLVQLAESSSYSADVVRVSQSDSTISGVNGISLMPNGAVSNAVNGQATLTDPNTAIEMSIMGAEKTSTSTIPYSIYESVAALDLAFSAAGRKPITVNLAQLGLGSTTSGGDPFAQLAPDGFTAGNSKTDNVGSLLDLSTGATALIGYHPAFAELDVLYQLSGTEGFQLDVLGNVAGQTSVLPVAASTVMLSENSQTSADVSDTSGNITLNTRGVAGITIDGVELTGTDATVSLTANHDLTWTGSDGTQYEFDPGAAFAENGLGTLQLSGGAIASTSYQTVTLDNFDLAAAQSQAGYDGIHLDSTAIALVSGTSTGSDPLQQSGTGDSAPAFTAGSSQSYTVTVSTPNDTPQVVTVSVSGVSPSDFGLLNGSSIDPLTAENGETGTFTVVVPAGETSATFTLVNTADVGVDNSRMLLSASIADPGNSSSQSVTSDPLVQTYVEPADDPFDEPSAGQLYSSGAHTTAGGLTYTGYSNVNSANGTVVSGVSGGPNYVSVSGVADDSIAGGSGNDTIFADFGYGLSAGGMNVIQGNGGRDILWAGGEQDTSAQAGPTSVQIYGSSAVDLTTAIENANSDSATGVLGDLIVSEVANATLVGGDGNNIFYDDSDGVVVAGPGNDSIYGGVRAYDTATGAPAGQVGAGDAWSAVQLVVGGPGESAPPDIANETIYGGSGDDYIQLSNGNNYVELGSGRSTVVGGNGENTLIGGDGDDSITGGNAKDYIEAGDGNTILVGNGGNNTLIGGAGDDTLIAGAQGNSWATQDTGDNYVAAGSGNTAIYGSGGNDTLLGGAGNDTINAGAGNEYVVGGSGDESVNGGAGNDTLDAGGDGSDTIWAGSGDTTIYGGDGSDVLNGGSGTDIIYAGDGGTSDAPTKVFAATGDTTIYGGEGVDYLNGGSGEDVIYAGDGGTADAPTKVFVRSGATTVYGGDGYDVIYGGNGTDVLYAGDGGTDDSPTYVIAGTGASTLYGGAGTAELEDTAGGGDLLVGGTGDETLAGTGDDTLVAGSGLDLLTGSGNVTYDFDSVGGSAQVEDDGGGTLEFSSDQDPADMSISVGQYSNGNSAMILSDDDWSVSITGGLTGGAGPTIVFDDPTTMSLDGLVQAADAAGNAYDTVIAGTDGNLVFDTANADSIAGGIGEDTISAWGDNDTLAAGGIGTTIYAQGADDQVTGGDGLDTLEASGANTTLTGGLGNETFYVNDATDVVQAQAGAASNTMYSSVSYTLPENVDVLTLTGDSDLIARGNDDATNIITGNAGNDTLIAGYGDDTLVAGSGVTRFVGSYGAATFVVNNVKDEIVSPSTQDTIESSVNWTLTQAIGALTLTGSDDLTAADDYGYAAITGNAGNDTLYGGGYSDTLIAGTGVDTLVTGTGRNTLVINNAADVIIDSAGASLDTIEASISYTLQSTTQENLDTLYLIGDGNLVATGDDDPFNYIQGNSGNDTLIAGSGSDTLVAGLGTDTLIAGSGNDTLQGNAGDTFDLTSGSALIEVAQGSGILRFADGVTAAQLTVSMTLGADYNPALLITDGNASITVEGGLQGSISDFDFSNGADLSLPQLLAAAGQVTSSTITGANGSADFVGGAAQSVTASDGNETVYAAGPNDTVIAGNGNQSLYALGANDVLAASTGLDTLYGGVGADTLIAGIGYTQMQGGTGDDTFVLTQGGTATLMPGSASGTELVYLPQGMTIADFAGYQSGNNLILQSLTGNTTAVISGFYGSASAQKTWLMADSSGDIAYIGNWVGSQNQIPPDATYSQEITAARGAYLAQLGISLNGIGEQGGSLANPSGTSPTTDYTYSFNGVSTQALTVTDDATLNIDSSDNDQKSYTTTTTEETETYTTPIYSTEAIGGGQFNIPVNSMSDYVDLSDDDTPKNSIPIYSNGTITTDYDSNGNVIGTTVTLPPVVTTVQTGTVTHIVTVPVQTTYTTETQGFTVYNVTTDNTDVSIDAAPNFVGSVVLGDGNDSVDMGGSADHSDDVGHLSVNGNLPGAFIELGNGNDTIDGTGGADAIAAGTGFDYIQGFEGTTYYVPMSGYSTDIIEANSAYYASGPYKLNTLVLPEGVTADNLQIRVFSDPSGQYIPPYGNYDDYNPETLQLTYNNSTVIVPIDFDPDWVNGVYWEEPNVPAGIQQFQFADGTMMTIAQMLALAGPVLSTDDYNPVVNAQSVTVQGGQSLVSASDLFSASDASGSNITWYKLSDGGGTGGYFTINGVAQAAGTTLMLNEQQLSQLQYVAGAAGTDDGFSVQAWDGIEWGQTAYGDVYNAGAAGQTTFAATGPDQWIYGPTSGPDTLIGGYNGDGLDGESGQDTFVYNSGGGSEIVSESATAITDDILRFGAGISVSDISLSLDDYGDLIATIGNNGDTVEIYGFNPVSPLAGSPIQQFEFADGTSLTLAQFLAQTISSSGSVEKWDGTTFNYEFNVSGGPIYSVQQVATNGQIMSGFSLNVDGSTQADSYAYNSDGSYAETVVTTSAGGAVATVVYDFDSSGHLIGQSGGSSTFQASSEDQTVNGAATGPDTLIGGYGGDTLVGASGQDTFVYNAGGGAEAVSETAATASNSANVLQFGSGIAAGDITLSVAAGGALIATVGSIGDSVTIEGFDPTAPLTSMPIQQFQFADGTSLSFNQLLNAVGSAGSSGEVSDADGGYTYYQFTPGSDTVYLGETYNANSQHEQSFSVGSDGSTDWTTYTYNTDGSWSETDVGVAGDGSGTTTTVTGYDASGNVVSVDTTNPDGTLRDYTYDSSGRELTSEATFTDGSISNTTYAYNADGSHSETQVSTDADGGNITTTVSQFDASGNETALDITNPDGSSNDYSYDTQGRVVSADSVYTDGSTSDTTYAYNTDGSHSETQVSADANGGNVTTSVSQFDASGNETALDITNPDGSTNDYTYDGQGRVVSSHSGYTDGSSQDSTFNYNNDGSYTRTDVDTPSDGAGVTTFVATVDASGTTTAILETDPDGTTRASTFSYGSDGSSTQTTLITPPDGSAATTEVSTYDGSGDHLSSNSYTPSSNGSYSDTWEKADGSNGGYWWDASASEYQATWTDTNGSSWTDDYQYASGGSPGASGTSFTETYSDSSGDQGTRQYDASTGVTSLTWYSAATQATATGTISDSGFIGLQQDGELTNTQQDPSFFNPAVSPTFASFLSAHG